MIVAELAIEVWFRASNQSTKWIARNSPLRQLSRTSLLVSAVNSSKTDDFPSTTGVRNNTTQIRRKAAVTAEGATEYLTKIDDREIPSTPITIMITGAEKITLIYIKDRSFDMACIKMIGLIWKQLITMIRFHRVSKGFT